MTSAAMFMLAAVTWRFATPEAMPDRAAGERGADGSLAISLPSERSAGWWVGEGFACRPGGAVRFSATAEISLADGRPPMNDVALVLQWWRPSGGRSAYQTDYLDARDIADGDVALRMFSHVLPVPDGCTRFTVEPMMRWRKGRAVFREVSAEPVPRPAPRVARVAIANPRRGGKFTSVEDRLRQVDAALSNLFASVENVDIAVACSEVFPESLAPMPLAEKADGGPTFRLLSRYAKRHRAWLAGGLREIGEDGGIRNSAILVDRQGRFAGKYSKTHLTFGEIRSGLIPGSSYPVFETDFGRVGFLICWDNFFPEAMRELQMNGAELVLFPIAATGEKRFQFTFPSRAYDTGLPLAVAIRQGERPSRIIGSEGDTLAEVLEDGGFCFADIDLAARNKIKWLSVNGYGTPYDIYRAERRPLTYGRLPETASAKIRLATIAPGHFHAALVQKRSYDGVSGIARVYAPAADGDLARHLRLVDSFNAALGPSRGWRERVYAGDDFLSRMAREREADVAVLAGRNDLKAGYALAAAESGMHVLADKPLAIDAPTFETLKRAVAEARSRRLAFTDMMTSRAYPECAAIEALAHDEGLFGGFIDGTPEEPAAETFSLHHFIKSVAGGPLSRPPWYYDTSKQGEGLADVTTHLVDRVMRAMMRDGEAPGPGDWKIVGVRSWPTEIPLADFRRSTGASEWPEYLAGNVDSSGRLLCLANGEAFYVLCGHLVKTVVRWDLEAPPGGGDVSTFTLRGRRAVLSLRPDKARGGRSTLFIAPRGKDGGFAEEVRRAAASLGRIVPGARIVEAEGGEWRLVVPDAARVTHDQAFGAFAEGFFAQASGASFPEWEYDRLLARYAITTGFATGRAEKRR